MRAAKSAVVGSVIGEDVDSVEGDGDGGGDWCAEVEEDRLERDTRLSRTSGPKAAGSLLLSSYPGTIGATGISPDLPIVKEVKPIVGPVEFPMLENLRTLFLDNCDLRDNYRLLNHFLENSPNLEKLTIRLCKLPGTSIGGKGKGKSKKTNSQLQDVMHFQCQKLKSTEIIYEKGGKIPELVSVLLDISGTAPRNTITLTKFYEAEVL